jgi:general secretion pathway protein I
MLHAERGARHRGGFTLIEVLAALVIVALGMMGVIQAVTQTVGNSAYLRDKTLAHWVAMNRLTELRLEASVPDLDETSGEVDYAGQRWRWQVEVTQTQVESMRRIDVGVGFADAGEDSTLATVTGFFGSALAAPGSAPLLWEGGASGAPTQPPAGDQPPADDQTPAEDAPAEESQPQPDPATEPAE